MTREEKDLILEVLDSYTLNGKVSRKKLEEVLSELVEEPKNKEAE